MVHEIFDENIGSGAGGGVRLATEFVVARDALLLSVNVWITLSPLRAGEGGGLAVAVGSHRAMFREKCRRVSFNSLLVPTCW